MVNSLKFWVEGNPFYEGFSLHIKGYGPKNEPFIAQEIKFAEMNEVYSYTDPCLKMTRDEAQMLIDALWNSGLRPTEGTGSAGALAATQKHLDDMRRLVFDAK